MTEIAIRWSGSLLILGAVLLGTAIVIASFAPETTQQLPPLSNALMFLSAALLLLSLPSMYARQANAAGWLGLLGYALLQIGMLLFVAMPAPALLYASFDRPFENSITAFVLGIILTLGLLLTGIATLRAGVYPRWASILLLGGMAGFFFSFFVAEWLPHLAGQVVGVIMGVILILSLVWIGFFMWTTPVSPL